MAGDAWGGGGHAWQGGMCGGGSACQGACIVGGVRGGEHAWQGGVYTTRYGQ